MSNQRKTAARSVPGWTTETELVRTYDRPVNVVDAVGVAVTDAVEEWPELSETPPLHRFVDGEKLNGLFGPEATDGNGQIPSVDFRFQGCRVTVMYGSSIRVIVRRES
ncbi:MAG: hypothetical protein A07HB70_02190 [uncultured archaeon A07HB70]|nr:MAG: hypothetical protein A07HB70_02190 [uncultured archaeon A07HB70]